ncbi:MAG: hypothetical protein IJ153_07725 [Clostridia bacterium]|nr:hypothetical protein [Clostridia bacterium]
MSLDLSDDGIFQNVLNEKSLLAHMRELYFQVNGKVLPDTMAAVFTHLNPWLFKVINPLVFVCIAYCINWLFGEAKQNTVLGCAVVLLLPFSFLTSAGYVATDTNYVWCAAAVLVSLIPLKDAEALKRHKLMYLVCVLSTIYAGNQEQSAAVLLAVYALVIIARLIRKEKVNAFVWFLLSVIVVSMFLLWMAPGHQNRTLSYSIFRTPDFKMLSFAQKLFRGFTSTMAYFIAGRDLLWPLLCFLLMLLVVCNEGINQSIAAKASSIMLFGSSITFGILQDILLPAKVNELFHYYPTWGWSMWDYRPIDAITYTVPRFYFPIIVSIILLGLVYLEFFWIFGRGGTSLVLSLVFSAGLATRMVMGLSPTLYGSSFRTFIFSYISLMICVVKLQGKLVEKQRKIPMYAGYISIFLSVVYTYLLSYRSIL